MAWARREDRQFRLDQVRWPGRLRRAALARLALFTALLVTAAGLLYGGTPQARCPAGGTAVPAPAATPGPATPGHVTPGPATPGHATPDLAGADDAGPEANGGTANGGRERHTDAAAERAATGPAQHRAAMPAGTVGVVVALAEPATLAVLRAGDRVDLLTVAAAGGDQPAPVVVARGAVVLATPGSADAAPGALYLALPPGQARAVVALQPTARFAVLVCS